MTLADPFLGFTSVGPNADIVYRALNAQDAERLAAGLGLEAKNVDGGWTLGEHIVNGSSRAARTNDPWISTTRVLEVARGFEGGHGVVAIDLSKVPSLQQEAWQLFPRVAGEAGEPYIYSIWQQEVSVFKSIPREAILGFVR